MGSKARYLAILAAVVLGGWAVECRADSKPYVWTYDYSTLARDSAELEYYQTHSTGDPGHADDGAWQHQAELEYGVTDHLDAALYEVFEQPENGTLSYAGYKVRVRYRIAEKNALPVDIVLYAEHAENTNEPGEFEGKLILAKDIGKLNLAYNEIFEKAYRSDAGAEHGYAAGMSYELTPAIRAGIESTGNFRFGTYAAGPTAAWSGGRIWVNAGAVFALNSKTPNREVRFLLGVPF